MQIRLIACILTVLVLTSTTGCLFLNPTRFTLHSSEVIDNRGFPSFTFSFNLTNQATVTITDPTAHPCFTQEFYRDGSTNATLGAFRYNLPSGPYTFNVKDAGGNTIFSQVFHWSAPTVSLQACQQHWYQRSNETVLTLNLTVSNTGELPFYPGGVQIQYGSTTATGTVIPCAVLPHQTADVRAYMVMSTQLSVRQMTIQLLDTTGTVTSRLPVNVSANTCPLLKFSWDYEGFHQLTLPNVSCLYIFQRSLPRVASPDYAVYVFDSLDDAYCTYVLHRILALAGTTDAIERLNFIAGFVQSLTYRADDPLNPSFEYPRYPIETLNEQGGDCEDKAILCAEFLTLAGYNVTLIRLPDHMAVGVHVPSLPEYTPFADGYYYLEATAGASPLGRVPDEFQGITNYTLYPISKRPLLMHEWLDATHFQSNREDYVHVQVLVINEGSVSAAVEVLAFFYASSVRYGTQSVVVPKLDAGSEAQVTLVVNVPKDIATVLKTQVLINRVVQQEKTSATMFP